MRLRMILLTPAEAARSQNVSTRTIYRWIALGLPTQTRRGRIVIDTDAMAVWRVQTALARKLTP